MHEYAHLLTLDDDQVDPTATHCLTTLLAEGCLFPLSTLERFENRFWQHVGEAAPDADSVSIQKVLFFWEQPEYVAIRAHIRDWFGSELPEPLLPVDNGHRG